MKYSILGLAILFSIGLSAQSNLGVGSWRDYLPYSGNDKIAIYDNAVYSASAFGILKVDIEDNSLESLSKVNGLSDVSISSLGSNENVLIIGYENGNMDLLTDGGIVNIPDLKNTSITGSKEITDLFFIDDDVYATTGFGILKLDVVKAEIKETIYIGSEGKSVFISGAEVYNDSVFALVNGSIMKAGIQDLNFENYLGWKIDSNSLNLFPTGRNLTAGNNRMMIVQESDVFSNDSVFEYESGLWNHVSALDNNQFNDLYIDVDVVYFANYDVVKGYDNSWEEVFTVFDYGGAKTPRPAALDLRDGEIWISDLDYGVVKTTGQWQSEVFVKNSPRGATSARIVASQEGDVWVAGGVLQANYSNTFNNVGLYHQLPSTEWVNINNLSSELMDRTFDFQTITTNGNITYAGSSGRGLVKIENGVPTVKYDSSNSSLSTAGNTDFINIWGSTFDRQGNLWVTNSGTQDVLHCLTPGGEWYPHTINQSINGGFYGEVIQAYQGYLWVVLPYNNGGILVYDFNNTPSNPDDDRYKVLNSAAGNGGLHSTDIYSIAEDVNGYIWVGTAAGVATFYSPNYVFDEGVNYDAQRVIVEVDGYNQYLLTTETVTSIAIDGGNRKWFGTTNGGIYLMSEDGSEELLHFTAENSPLLSNRVESLAFNPANGELIVGTDKGIQAYKSSSTGPDPIMADVLAYPNPVRSDYNGLIAIKGLAYESQVRITDISGRLVFSTVSEGGQAIWNGEDMNGNKVSFGVYLVFAVDELGQEKEVSKIMFVR